MENGERFILIKMPPASSIAEDFFKRQQMRQKTQQTSNVFDGSFYHKNKDCLDLKQPQQQQINATKRQTELKSNFAKIENILNDFFEQKQASNSSYSTSKPKMSNLNEVREYNETHTTTSNMRESFHNDDDFIDFTSLHQVYSNPNYTRKQPTFYDRTSDVDSEDVERTPINTTTNNNNNNTTLPAKSILKTRMSVDRIIKEKIDLFVYLRKMQKQCDEKSMAYHKNIKSLHGYLQQVK
jgi:hypothetical protein